jgi:hypothetical protein
MLDRENLMPWWEEHPGTRSYIEYKLVPKGKDK